MKTQKTLMDQVLSMHSPFFETQTNGTNKVQVFTAYDKQLFATIDVSQENEDTPFINGVKTRVEHQNSESPMRASSPSAIQNVLETWICRKMIENATTLDDSLLDHAIFLVQNYVGKLSLFPNAERFVNWKACGNRLQYGNLSILVGADKSLIAQIEHKKKVYSQVLPFVVGDVPTIKAKRFESAIEFFVATKKSLGLKIEPHQIKLCSSDFQKDYTQAT